MGSSLVSVAQHLDWISDCQLYFYRLTLAFVVICVMQMGLEVALIVVSCRGSILQDHKRWPAEYLLYTKLVVFVCELGLTIRSVIWLIDHFTKCNKLPQFYHNVILGIVVCNFVLFLTTLMTIWCFYDVAGKHWVKLKKYQQSLKDREQVVIAQTDYRRAAVSLFPTQFITLGSEESKNAKVKITPRSKVKRSGNNPNRTWRHRKVRMAYQNSWNQRCQYIFCCVQFKDQKSRNSFSAIARVLSEFFRDLDVVPTDVIVGLVLLRQRQQLQRIRVVLQPTNSVYRFLSGVRVTPTTGFLTDPTIIREAYRYMHFATGIYGWPVYLKQNRVTGLCKLCSGLSCAGVICCLCGVSCCESGHDDHLVNVVEDDNCCGCNFSALKKVLGRLSNTRMVYIAYHVDVGETPFLIALDYEQRSVVICIRGTLSLGDVITDLNAEGEPLPIKPVNEDWMGHKGMVDTASYIHQKLKSEGLLTKAWNWDRENGSHEFGLVCVGHSLGAGTASILAIMLKQDHPSTRCFAFSPPGGLLSKAAVSYSRDFVTSVVLGKDVVPRIGLHQLESLRHDLVQAIQQSQEPKWRTLTSSMVCCSSTRRAVFHDEDVEAAVVGGGGGSASVMVKEVCEDETLPRPPSGASQNNRIHIHPLDNTINLSVHQHLYPPGRMLHIVRQWTKATAKGHQQQASTSSKERFCEYKIIEADNSSFDEVLISKRMVQDHMPDTVLNTLEELCYGDKWNCDSVGGGEALGATTPPQMQQPKTTAKSQPAKDDAPLKEAPNDNGRHNERFASKKSDSHSGKTVTKDVSEKTNGFGDDNINGGQELRKDSSSDNQKSSPQQCNVREDQSSPNSICDNKETADDDKPHPSPVFGRSQPEQKEYGHSQQLNDTSYRYRVKDDDDHDENLPQ